MNPSLYVQSEINIKKFKKGKRLSKTGLDFVCQVEERDTGKLYAAKVINCGDDEELCDEIIEHDIRVKMHIKHPTIIKFIGYSRYDFHEEHNITVIMELMKNGSLADVIRNIQNKNIPKNYTNTSRQMIIIGIAKGMKYIQERQIIHKNLKATNILLDDQFQPHITDFGIEKFNASNHLSSQNQFGFSIPYQSPEVLKNLPYDKKVDVFKINFS